MTHICVSKLTIIGSDNGLSPVRRQAIIWTYAGILLIRPLGTNFNEMWIELLIFSFMKMRLKVSSAKWRPFCLGLNVLIHLYPERGSSNFPDADRETEGYISRTKTLQSCKNAHPHCFCTGSFILRASDALHQAANGGGGHQLPSLLLISWLFCAERLLP